MIYKLSAGGKREVGSVVCIMDERDFSVFFLSLVSWERWLLHIYTMDVNRM